MIELFNRFSVIGTCFNDSKIIIRYLENMIQQTIQPEKYIIVDGGSTDNTVELVKAFAKQNNISIDIICKGRLNIAQGYNEAIRQSETDLIIITGIGNLYEKDFFRQLLLKAQETESDVVYGRIVGQNNNHFSESYNRVFLGGDKGIIPSMPSNRGCLIKKEVFYQQGFFLESFIYAGEDTEFFKRIMSNGIVFSTCDNAELYWETPKNLRQYIKQQSGYFLGSYQHSGLNLKSIIKSAVIHLVVIISILAIFILKVWVVIPCFFALIYAMFSIKTHTIDPTVVFIKFLSLWLPFYLLLKNIRKINQKNRVSYKPEV